MNSSSKVAKQARKMIRKAMNERIAQVHELLKPCPKWLPNFMWTRIVKMVIDIKLFNEKYARR